MKHVITNLAEWRSAPPAGTAADGVAVAPPGPAAAVAAAPRRAAAARAAETAARVRTTVWG